LAIPIPNCTPNRNPIPNRNPNTTVSLTLSQPNAKPDACAKKYLAYVRNYCSTKTTDTCYTNTQRKLTCAFVRV